MLLADFWQHYAYCFIAQLIFTHVLTFTPSPCMAIHALTFTLSPWPRPHIHTLPMAMPSHSHSPHGHTLTFTPSPRPRPHIHTLPMAMPSHSHPPMATPSHSHPPHGHTLTFTPYIPRAHDVIFIPPIAINNDVIHALLPHTHTCTPLSLTHNPPHLPHTTHPPSYMQTLSLTCTHLSLTHSEAPATQEDKTRECQGDMCSIQPQSDKKTD